MRKHKNHILLVLGSLTLVGCYKPPEFDEIPLIRFEDINFIRYENSPDSLNLTFYFEDGDGDIGLNPDQTYPPYNPYDWIIDSEGYLVTYGSDSVQPPFYTANINNEVRFFSQEDSRPSYSCSEYVIGKFFGLTVEDTFFISKNEHFNNIYLTFYSKFNGEYILVDPAKEFGHTNCDAINFDGRIPVFDEEILGRSLSGTITYHMTSSGFEILFRNDTFKIEFYIYDQALNPSNIASTPDLTLPSITK